MLDFLQIVLGAARAGRLKFRISPWKRRPWGGPFNGQSGRVQIFAELMQHVNPVAVVETGTYLGETTEWLSAFQVPVYSVEAIPFNYGFAQSRLIHISNVKLYLKDSRTALKDLLSGPLMGQKALPIVFYLDAHWYEDLPLADELEIIFSQCAKAVVLIDDFQHPSDSGYAFDDYGEGRALNIDYLRNVARKYNLAVFFPVLRSNEETGSKRGSAVVTTSSFATSHIEKLVTISKWNDWI